MSGRRSTLPAQRFERTGLLCVEPRAFFDLFLVPATRANTQVDHVEIIDISGPLVQRDELWCDSYEAIRDRFRVACGGDARAIVMRIDSPGGDASGCFETARALRAEAEAARKPLFAYIDRACSAAYALASAANQIAIGETCCAGSIGVLSNRADFSQRNLMNGLRMAFVTSGQRKLDGNPDVPISEAELIETQRHVDDLASKFFALIADQRPQLAAATLAGFDGGVFYGDSAVGAGLADAVLTFEETLAIASKGDPMTMLAKSDYEVALGALEKLAKGEDPNAAAARKALAALGAGGGEGEGGGEDEPADTEPPADSAEGDDEKPAAEGGDDEKPAAEGGEEKPAASDDSEPPADKKPKSEQAGSTSAELTLAAKVHRMEAQMAAERDQRERRRLMASRADFGAELRAALAKAPLATVREMVKTLPRGKPAAPKKAITTVGATRAMGQGDGSPSARTSEASELDRRMGLGAPQVLGCRREGTSLIFGVTAAPEKPATTPTTKPASAADGGHSAA